MKPGPESLRVARKIVEGRKLRLAAHKQRRTPAQSNRASSLGHPCARFLYYMRTDAVRELPETSDTLQSIFDEGNLHEEDIKRQLSEMGFSVYATQDSFPPNSYQVTGSVDMKLPVGKGNLVIEAKSLNQTHFEQIATYADGIGNWESVKNHGAQFIRGHYTQAQIYAFLQDTEDLLLLYKGKGTGEWKPVPLPLDLDHVQECLSRAEKVNAALVAGRFMDYLSVPLEVLPPFVSDRSVCLRCPFAARVCRPPGMDPNDAGLFVFQDEQAELACETLVVRKGAHGQYEQAQKYLRETMRLLTEGKDRILAVGDYIIVVKFSENGTMRMAVEKLA